MSKKKSFVCYEDWAEVVYTLSDETAGKLIKAMFRYALGGEDEELCPELRPVMMLIKGQLDRDREKWEQTCRKRSEAGRKSGAVRNGKRTKRTNVNYVEQTQTKRTDNEYENVDVNENENEDVDVNEGEGEREYENAIVNVNENENAPAAETAACGAEGACAPVNAPAPAPHSNKNNSSIAALKEEYGEALVKEYLERVWDYCKSTGKTYRDPTAAARRWLRDDIRSGKIKPPVKTRTDSYDDDYGYYNVLDTSCYCEDS